MATLYADMCPMGFKLTFVWAINDQTKGTHRAVGLGHNIIVIT